MSEYCILNRVGSIQFIYIYIYGTLFSVYLCPYIDMSGTPSWCVCGCVCIDKYIYIYIYIYLFIIKFKRDLFLELSS